MTHAFLRFSPFSSPFSHAELDKDYALIFLSGMRPVKCVNRLVRFRSASLYLACYQLRLLLPLFLVFQFRQRSCAEVTLAHLPLVVLL
jgi:hypothetical protein